MKKALIGYSGFVGSNLLDRIPFDDTYNSKNIESIRNKNYDLIYCAGISAVKYLANLNPSDDLKNIMKLIDNLREVKANKFILISTIDVYKNVNGVDEDTIINLENHHAYGTHRRIVESFISERFSSSLIVRLPGLFGKGLKKNIIYDFLHNNETEKIDSRHIFQFYNLDNLSKDIDIALKNNLSLINFATEPVSVYDVAKNVFDINFNNIIAPSVIKYDMLTKYAKLYGKNDKYLYDKNTVINEIKSYIKGIK